MIYRDKIMGSPPRAWENNEDIMEVENLYSAFFARDNIDILNGKNSYILIITVIITIVVCTRCTRYFGCWSKNYFTV